MRPSTLPADGNDSERDRGPDLRDPDLPGAAALGQGHGSLRRLRLRRRRQLLRRGLAGGAQPHPMDDLLRGPLGAQRDRHPQALVAAMRLAAARLVVLASSAALLTAASGCGNGDDGDTPGSGLPSAGGGGTLTYALPVVPAKLDPLAARGRVQQTVTRQVYEPLTGSLHGPYGQTQVLPGLA